MREQGDGGMRGDGGRAATWRRLPPPQKSGGSEAPELISMSHRLMLAARVLPAACCSLGLRAPALPLCSPVGAPSHTCGCPGRILGRAAQRHALMSSQAHPPPPAASSAWLVLVQGRLQAAASDDVRLGQDAYFKGAIRHRGVKTPGVEAVCKAFLRDDAAAGATAEADDALRALGFALLRQPLQVCVRGCGPASCLFDCLRHLSQVLAAGPKSRGGGPGRPAPLLCLPAPPQLLASCCRPSCLCQEDKLAGMVILQHCLLRRGGTARWRQELADLQRVYEADHVPAWWALLFCCCCWAAWAAWQLSIPAFLRRAPTLRCGNSSRQAAWLPTCAASCRPGLHPATAPFPNPTRTQRPLAAGL